MTGLQITKRKTQELGTTETIIVYSCVCKALSRSFILFLTVLVQGRERWFHYAWFVVVLIDEELNLRKVK